jgi:hypothetical protein
MRTEGEEATSTNGVSDSFQKMRSDCACIIRRDARLETGNERQGGVGGLRENAVQGEETSTKRCVSAHCRAAANECRFCR